MRNGKLVFDVAISAMDIEELTATIASDKTNKPDFQEAIGRFVKQNPKGFEAELKAIAESPNQHKVVRSRIVFFLIKEGYVDSNYPEGEPLEEE